MTDLDKIDPLGIVADFRNVNNTILLLPLTSVTRNMKIHISKIAKRFICEIILSWRIFQGSC